uniref:Dynein heavy chain 9, axonemallike [Takifugu rubripes] n=1 Tax=Lepeophtheirus salmonis TaxID=72036 RepID=A0A0K2V6A2_LEPSM
MRKRLSCLAITSIGTFGDRRANPKSHLCLFWYKLNWKTSQN